MDEPRGSAHPPIVNGDEKTTLMTFLDYLRETVVFKVSEVSETDARSGVVDAGTTLLWLLKHLTAREQNWFGWAFAGEGEESWPDPAALDELDSVEGLIIEYRAAIAESNRVIADSQLDTTVAREFDGEYPTLRWTLIHMIEETARHLGHADILRERIDDAVETSPTLDVEDAV